MFCGYHKVYIKHLTNSSFAADSNLSSFVYLGFIIFLFPFDFFIVSNYSFLCYEFFTKFKYL